MRAGDYVLHKPTGERWVVAKVLGEDFYACGWPCTMGRIDDTELIESAPDERYQRICEDLRRLPGSDPRHLED